MTLSDLLGILHSEKKRLEAEKNSSLVNIKTLKRLGVINKVYNIIVNGGAADKSEEDIVIEIATYLTPISLEFSKTFSNPTEAEQACTIFRLLRA